jgi:hypothetical protein
MRTGSVEADNKLCCSRLSSVFCDFKLAVLDQRTKEYLDVMFCDTVT